jgi:uracil-DNA glycosylase family 4
MAKNTLLPISIESVTLYPTWQQRQEGIQKIEGIFQSYGLSFQNLSPSERIGVVRKAQETCLACKQRKDALYPFPSHGSVNPEFVFINRNPSGQDERKGYLLPHQTREGSMYDKYLKVLDVTRRDVYFTNAVKCHSFNDEAPLRNIFYDCSPWMYYELLSINLPKIIFTLGYDAHQLFFDYRQRSLASIFGTIYRAELFNQEVYIVPLYHPYQVAYHKELWRDVVSLLYAVRSRILYPFDIDEFDEEFFDRDIYELLEDY